MRRKMRRFSQNKRRCPRLKFISYNKYSLLFLGSRLLRSLRTPDADLGTTENLMSLKLTSLYHSL
jgi:hypothetical protein